MSQPQRITLLNGCCGNSSLTQVRANWPYHIIYGQLTPSSSLWPLDHLTSSLDISCLHWPSWQTLHLTNPQAITFVFGPGGPFNLPGAYGPLAQPLILVGFSPKWPFWAI
ncbi:hypothetical protein O181_072612 [Austropuccinia psidii MF-1]|uniref:Uncharacterized protein n=1 Tax=Austropuccinia psidii MF-1 TaxID=1389203 RepID=A0A9Q3F7G6_9BASI|nr:hypothetical protein [Austropuccinia psidii MF-1]